MSESIKCVYPSDTRSELQTPLSAEGVSAGFPSPADDFMDIPLDLNRELVRNPASTFYARVSGESMCDEGIHDGDLLVVDKSVEAYDGCLAVCFVEGEFTLKRFRDMGDYALLEPANKNYAPIRITSESDFSLWGVVRYVIKKV